MQASNSSMKKYLDQSTEDGFTFAFYCEMCGEKFQSDYVDSLSGISRKTEWQKEHDIAFYFAEREAKRRFNLCIACMSWVCDRHFDPEARMCARCAAAKEQGAPGKGAKEGL